MTFEQRPEGSEVMNCMAKPAMGSLVRNSTAGFDAAATELSSSLSDNHSLNLCSSASRFKSQMGIAKWPSLVQLPTP